MDDDDDEYEDIDLGDLDDEETSLDTSMNDDSWVRPTPRHVSHSLRSQYHRKHRAIEPTTSSPSISYGTPSKDDDIPVIKTKKSISSSLRSRFSSKKKRPRDIKSIANGLKLAQTQAIAVAGFLADVDAKVYGDTCFSHRASYHGRGGFMSS